MQEGQEGFELEPYKQGQAVPKSSAQSTPFWTKVVCFITGDVTSEELEKIGQQSRADYADYKMAQEVPPNIQQAKQSKKK